MVEEKAMSTSTSLAKEIESLMADLVSSREAMRRHARESLVAIGEPAIAALMLAQDNPNEHVRWEAVKALEDIGGPGIASILVQILENEKDGSIRWLAAEGLIRLKREGLAPLLQALAHHSHSARLREEARYVLRSLAKTDLDLNGRLTAVLAALESTNPARQVAPAAQATLNALTETASSVTVKEIDLDCKEP